MPRTSRTARFDFRKRVSYDPGAKRLFHNHARRRLFKLAEVLGFTAGMYDLRSNEGGIAVSGEVTLHADRLYVMSRCASRQPAVTPASCSVAAKAGAITSAALTISPPSICSTARPSSPAASRLRVLRSSRICGC
jgi:hypothetical protein